MVFHENRLLADDSHVVSCLIFVGKLGKVSQKLLSAAVVIGALRLKHGMVLCIYLGATGYNFQLK